MRVIKGIALVVTVMALCGAGSAVAGDLQIVLPGRADTGVSLTIELPALSGATGNGLGLQLERVQAYRGASLEIGESALTLPGLDGLSAAQSDGGSPLGGLNPELSRALGGSLGNRSAPRDTSSLSTPLPGLGKSARDALPGLDGLPIGVATP